MAAREEEMVKKPRIRLVIGLAAMLAGLTLLSACASGLLPGGNAATSPRLLVDQDRIDFGQVPYNKPVKAVFQLRNGGDQTLRIVGEPQVDVVKGC